MRCLRLFFGTLLTLGLIGVLAVSPAYAPPPFDPPGLARALAAQSLHTEALLRIEGVVGTATGLGEDGSPAVLVFTERPGIAGIPLAVDGVRVVVKVTGKFFALHHCKGKHAEDPECAPPPDEGGDGGGEEVDPTSRFPQPVPVGVSTGHPDITAGTIGSRVKNATDVYALSNNHVYCNENNYSPGDNVLQPGPYDGGIDPDDSIGTLSDCEPIIFNCNCMGRICFCDPAFDNVMDAAIASSSKDLLGNATPSNGYGKPQNNATLPAAPGQQVQKYGRTTSLTTGEVTGINATVAVQYNSGVARFKNQIIVESGGAFIKGGDSGSLLVTDPERYSVGLLFAGNNKGDTAIANPIYPILTRFGVTIDGE